MKKRKAQLKTRVTEKEKLRIENKAKKCGLSVSEYVRKRALEYSPKALLPESFYEFTEKLGVLYEGLGVLNSTELQEEVLKLLDEIYAKLITPERKDGDLMGSPQSLLCGEKEHPRNGELFDACGKNDEWSVM